LAGFFISQLWTRYTEIRKVHSMRSSDGLSMVNCAEHFYENKVFEKEFKRLVETSSVVDETVEWNEGHLEIPYYQNIENSFRHISIKDKKDEVYFNHLLINYHEFVESTVRLDTLGKEKLFPSEWLIMFALSSVIGLSILFLDISHFFYQIIVLTFPAIITLALSIIYDLDTLLWSKELVSLEPNQRLFDAVGAKRFYQTRKKGFVSSYVEDYRTEEDLTGDLKEAHFKIIESRKKAEEDQKKSILRSLLRRNRRAM